MSAAGGLHATAGAAPRARSTARGKVEVTAVRTAAERDRFIAFQLELYKDDPWYVPPIVAERRDFLDRDKNPFLEHAELELFLAHRGGQLVGRIAAINDAQYNQFHNTEVGFFGMFDCVDDPQVASALFDAAAGWIRAHGMKTLVGPANLSFNHDSGLLVDGFDSSPAMMMTYNYPYYAALVERAGFRKWKDLWSYEVSTSVVPPEKVVQEAERIRAQEKVTIRRLDPRDLAGEQRRLKTIYDAMLDRQWGFVPMTDGEFDAIAARLKPLVLLRPELCLIAEIGGEPVAFSLTFPDCNVALKAANGHLTRYGLPLGLCRMAWAARQIHWLRVLLLGVVPAYRRRGLHALLYLDTIKGARDLGYSGAEIGWTTEDNDLINRTLEATGARRYKTYRLYERPL